MNLDNTSKINRSNSLSAFNPLHSEEKTSSKPVTFFGKELKTSPSVSFVLRKVYNSVGYIGAKAWSHLPSFANPNNAMIPVDEMKGTKSNISKYKARGDHDIAGLYSMKREALLKNNVFASEALSLLAEGEEKLKALPEHPTKEQELELKTILEKLVRLQDAAYYVLKDGDAFTQRVLGKIDDLRAKVKITNELDSSDLETIAGNIVPWLTELSKKSGLKGYVTSMSKILNQEKQASADSLSRSSSRTSLKSSTGSLKTLESSRPSTPIRSRSSSQGSTVGLPIDNDDASTASV